MNRALWQAGGTLPQFQSVAFVDISEESLKDAREATGLGAEACFVSTSQALAQIACDLMEDLEGGCLCSQGSLTEALAAVESDAVMIVTSPGSHTALCLESVAAGKHLLVEKPFTKSLAEAVQIMNAADAAGVKVMVCQNDRFRSVRRWISRPVFRPITGHLAPNLGQIVASFGMLSGYFWPTLRGCLW